MRVSDGIKQTIALEELLNEVHRLKNKGYRLVQISCTTLKEQFELYYSFSKEMEIVHLHLEVGFEKEVPSITIFYGTAFLYENEMHDLFGLNITHISVDYQGDLYRMAHPTPFGPQTKQKKEADGNE